MSDEINAILDDERVIRSITFQSGETFDTQTDSAHKIVAYPECGEFCYIPWFAVKEYSGEVIARVPAHHVTVVYA